MSDNCADQQKEAPQLPLSPAKVTVARFSRRVMSVVIAAVTAITAFALTSAFSPKEKATGSEGAQQPMAKETTSQASDPTAPACIATGVKDYGEIGGTEAAATDPNGVPRLGPALTASQQLSAGSGNGTGGENANPYVVHPLPSASGTTLTPKQQAILAREELRHKEALEARRSGLSFGREAGAPQTAAPAPLGVSASSTLDRLEGLAEKIGAPNGGMAGGVPGTAGGEDQNRQDEKREFVREKRNELPYLTAPLLRPISPFELKAGTILPATLITGINSDLPGQIVAQLRENVFDTVTGKYLLLPQGTRLIGEYDSKVSYGQSRVLVVWSRIITPGGNSMNLEGMPGVDLSGYAGATGRVNNHYAKLITGVILGSVIGAGAQVAVGGQGAPNVPPTFGQMAVSGAAQNINEAGQQITQKNLNLQPTIEVPPGLKINVFVTRDMILKPLP